MECFRLQKHKIVNCNRQNIVKFVKRSLQILGKIGGGEVAKCDNSREDGDGERDGDGVEVQNVVKPNKLPANYNHFVKSH